MATATFTEVVPRVDAQLTNAIYKDQIQDNLNQLGGAHRQLLVNGGFERWQRGASFSTTGAVTADMWVAGATPAATITQETTTIDSASASALKIVTSTANGLAEQTIEDYVSMRGKTLSFSIRVRQGVASNVRAYIKDNVTTTNGATVATTGAYVTITVTATVGAAATSLKAGVQLLAADTVYLDNAMLVIGPAPAPYQPLHPAEDLARCQRYYEVFSVNFNAYNAAGAAMAQTYGYKVTKGGTPTLTKNGTWAVLNCGQPTVTAVPNFEKEACYLSATVTALGAAAFGPNSADDTITAQWDPP